MTMLQTKKFLEGLVEISGGISLGPKIRRIECEKEVAWSQNIKCHEVGG